MWVVKIMVHGHTATEVLQTLYIEVIGLLECMYIIKVWLKIFASPQLGDSCMHYNKSWHKLLNHS